MGQQSMLKGAFVAVLAAALLVIGVGTLIYVGIARQRHGWVAERAHFLFQRQTPRG